jgi:hypothetical protein
MRDRVRMYLRIMRERNGKEVISKRKRLRRYISHKRIYRRIMAKLSLILKALD